MKKILLCVTSVVMLFCLSSCSFGKFYYANLDDAKGVEVYCEKVNENYECRACEGTNRNKTDDEIKRLYPIKIDDMKEILESKNLIDCSRIILIEINDKDIEYLSLETYSEEYEFLYNFFGK